MKTLTIESAGKKKTRSFTVEFLAYIESDLLMSGGGNDKRPIWLAYAGSEQESKMFSINFLHGEKAFSHRDRYHLLKTAGYKAHTKKIGSDVVTTVYLPHLFWIDPGRIDPNAIEFVMLMSNKWAMSQNFDLVTAKQWLYSQVWCTKEVSDMELTQILAEAILFPMYLDRRSRFPMPVHPHFSLSLLNACLREGLAIRKGGYYNNKIETFGLDSLNLRDPILVTADHDHFGQVLAKEVALWHV